MYALMRLASITEPSAVCTQDMALNRRLFKYLVLVDEMVIFQSAEVSEAKFESK